MCQVLKLSIPGKMQPGGSMRQFETARTRFSPAARSFCALDAGGLRSKLAYINPSSDWRSVT